MNYPSGKDDWITFQKNNPTIALNTYMLKNEYMSSLQLKTT